MGKANRIYNAQNRTYIHNMLKSYVLGGFKWDGLPEGLTSQQLEQFICMNGMACGFKHPLAGSTILPSVWGAPLNLYFLPNFYIAYGAGWEGDVSADESVAFYDNSSRRGLRSLIDHTECSLLSIVSAQKINTAHQKNPWIFIGDEDEKQSLLAALQKVDENVPAIITTKTTMSGIETAKQFYPTNVPFIAQDFQQAFRQELNSFLSVLGFDNVTIEKKERLITDEAHSNDASVMFHRLDRLRAREEAADEFNRMFGANLTVEWVGCNDCDNTADANESGEEVTENA